jgi:hypothetical protein
MEQKAAWMAWMTQFVMKEWLDAFYLHIGLNRNVLLVMDNCSSHIKGLEHSPPPLNVRLLFLPPNSTSRFQPLDQGIIASLKAHYRRQWLQYMLSAYENFSNPLDSMTIHLALRWLIRSWHHDVTNCTIYNCFRKSTLLVRPITLPIEAVPPLDDLYSAVQQAGQIRDAMALSNFLNPADEAITEVDEQSNDL